MQLILRLIISAFLSISFGCRKNAEKKSTIPINIFQRYDSMAQYIVDFKVLQWSLVQEGKDKTNIWCSVNIASNYQEHNVSALNLSFQEKELLYQSLLRNSFFSLPVKIMPEKIFDDAGLMTREAFAGDTYTLSFILPNTNKTIKAVGIDYVYGNIELDSFWNILELTKLVISNHSEDISSVQNNAGR